MQYPWYLLMTCRITNWLSITSWIDYKWFLGWYNITDWHIQCIVLQWINDMWSPLMTRCHWHTITTQLPSLTTPQMWTTQWLANRILWQHSITLWHTIYLQITLWSNVNHIHHNTFLYLQTSCLSLNNLWIVLGISSYTPQSRDSWEIFLNQL